MSKPNRNNRNTQINATQVDNAPATDVLPADMAPPPPAPTGHILPGMDVAPVDDSPASLDVESMMELAAAIFALMAELSEEHHRNAIIACVDTYAGNPATWKALQTALVSMSGVCTVNNGPVFALPFALPWGNSLVAHKQTSRIWVDAEGQVFLTIGNHGKSALARQTVNPVSESTPSETGCKTAGKGETVEVNFDFPGIKAHRDVDLVRFDPSPEGTITPVFLSLVKGTDERKRIVHRLEPAALKSKGKHAAPAADATPSAGSVED